MLLPEANRSSVPFVVSLTLQCSLVLLLAIPWTVQTLRSSAPLQSPVVLNIQPPKPMEPIKTIRTQDPASTSLPVFDKQIRVFYPPLAKSNTSSSDSLLSAPDVSFDPRAPIGFGEPARIADVIVRPEVRIIDPKPRTDATTPEPLIVVGGNVQAAKLIRRLQPLYPTLARQTRVQGTVTLEAIIGSDGTIQHLRVLNGHPLLIQSAVQAVQQWMYSPTILNGKPVEVKTTIEVRFTLSEP